VADPTKASTAISSALFPENLFMQSIIKATVDFYLKCYRAIPEHFDDAINNYFNNLSKTPALVFSSKADPIGTSNFAKEFGEKWKARGTDVTYKCFEDSEHVKHFQKYPEDYLKTLHDHWEKVKLLEKN
jgi:alpha-beta hydrolase superfamily lysophospholipase